jgi:LysR family hydrogen peroxide-inducible transcriptional activator
VARDADESRPSQGSSLETIRNMVASGLGISVVPESALGARHTSRLCKVIPFDKPAPSRQIGLAWRSGYARTAAIDAVAEAVLAVKERQAGKPVGARAPRRRS